MSRVNLGIETGDLLQCFQILVIQDASADTTFIVNVSEILQFLCTFPVIFKGTRWELLTSDSRFKNTVVHFDFVVDNMTLGFVSHISILNHHRPQYARLTLHASSRSNLGLQVRVGPTASERRLTPKEVERTKGTMFPHKLFGGFRQNLPNIKNVMKYITSLRTCEAVTLIPAATWA